MSLLSRLRAVVSGDDYLDGYDDDELDYDQGDVPESSGSTRPGALALSSDFQVGDPFAGTNVIGMPGISTAAAEVTLMEPDQAQRAVDFVAGGTFAIDGHQERVGESIFLFAPSCVTVTTATGEEASSPTIVSRESAPEQDAAPSPAWGRQEFGSGLG